MERNRIRHGMIANFFLFSGTLACNSHLLPEFLTLPDLCLKKKNIKKKQLKSGHRIHGRYALWLCKIIVVAMRKTNIRNACFCPLCERHVTLSLSLCSVCVVFVWLRIMLGSCVRSMDGSRYFSSKVS